MCVWVFGNHSRLVTFAARILGGRDGTSWFPQGVTQLLWGQREMRHSKQRTGTGQLRAARPVFRRETGQVPYRQQFGKEGLVKSALGRGL